MVNNRTNYRIVVYSFATVPYPTLRPNAETNFTLNSENSQFSSQRRHSPIIIYLTLLYLSAPNSRLTCSKIPTLILQNPIICLPRFSSSTKPAIAAADLPPLSLWSLGNIFILFDPISASDTVNNNNYYTCSPACTLIWQFCFRCQLVLPLAYITVLSQLGSINSLLCPSC